MARIRKDVAKLTVDPETGWIDELLWYARAVKALDERPLQDRTSWRFLAAIHGCEKEGWKDLLREGESFPTELENQTFGEQCQHGGWYFLPWHRGYLAAFEEIVASVILQMGGPQDWALPYWNYLNDKDPHARRIPDAFLSASWPDGGENPLNQVPRKSGVVSLEPFVTIFGPTDISPESLKKVMDERDFQIGLRGSLTFGFGGAMTGFEVFGRVLGALENDPHNAVHVMIGGLEDDGYMSNPDRAALDPIFWLHHCNIDRMWEAWMRAPNRNMAQDPRWLDGPARYFRMPDPQGEETRFTPRETLAGGGLHPAYDDLSSGVGLEPESGGPVVVGMGGGRSQAVEVIGASEAPVVVVGGELARSLVRVDRRADVFSMGGAGAARGEGSARLYLSLENITGSTPSAVVDVFVNLPAEASEQERAAHNAGALYLFGLAKASRRDRGHAGNGLSFVLDITDLAARLSAEGAFDPEALEVEIAPIAGGSAEVQMTVGRISVLQRLGAAQE